MKDAERTEAGLDDSQAERLDRLVKMLDERPGDLRARRELGDLYQKAGRYDEAVRTYQALVGAYAAQGLLFKAISVAKRILELRPDHEETQHTLAELIAKKEGRKTSVAMPAALGLAVKDELDASALIVDEDPQPRFRSAGDVPIVPRAGARDRAPPPLPPEALVEEAEVEAGDFVEEELIDGAALGGVSVQDGAVIVERPPAVPLFSGLSRETFLALLPRLQAWEAPPGTAIVAEGEPAASLFVVVRGKVRVQKRVEGAAEPVTLSELGPDSFFGEMALLSSSPRTASVVAVERTELLEIPKAVLDELCLKDPTAAAALERFCHERLVANLALTSPVLKDLPDAVRADLMPAFVAKKLSAQDTLLTEGKEGSGLYIVLSGDVDVVKRADIGSIRLKQLKPGDLVGEMSVLSGNPASASVVAVSPASVLHLPKKQFQRLAQKHPELRRRVEKLMVVRRAFNQRFLPEAPSSSSLV